jgi:hypothetical protein
MGVQEIGAKNRNSQPTYRLPIDFNNDNNMAGVIINNIIKEEYIAKQQAPLDNAIFT